MASTHPSERRRAYLLSETERETLLEALDELNIKIGDTNGAPLTPEDKDALETIADARKALRA
jgi:hypothetical protein